MPLRLNAKQLRELIESTEAGGGNAVELVRELEALEPEAKHATGRRDLRDEEETLRDRLNREVGDLFGGGVSDELESRLEAMDRDYGQKELQEMCRGAGISPSGHKKKLAALLIAHNLAPTEKAREIRIVRDETAFYEEPLHPALPEGVRYPVQYKEIKAVIDDIGHITYIYWPSVRVGHIEAIDIEPASRRLGFGSKLMQFAIDDMKKKGIVKVSASILSKAGAQLLKAHGFSFANDLMEVRL